MPGKTTIETHPVSDYVRDDRVNRFLSPARVAKLRANLDLDAIGVFIVSKRPNGDLVILDGGHRAAALAEEDTGEFEVPAIVHHDLDEEGEASLFLRYNDRLAVDILDRFRLQVTAKDPESLVLDRAIRAAGFIPSKQAHNRLSCIGALQTVYRGGTSTGREAHLKVVKSTLSIIERAWGTDDSAIKETVRGIGGLLLQDDGKIDHERLIERLAVQRGGPTAIRIRAHYHTREGGHTAGNGSELAVAEIYNKGLHASKKVKV